MMRLPGGDASEPLMNVGLTLRRIYSDPNSGDEGCSRTSAAGSWMVGPPSSWSLRDQEDAIWRASSSDCPRVDASPSLRGCEAQLLWKRRTKMSRAATRRFRWRSSPSALDFPPGLAYDLQPVAILFVPRAGGCVGGNMLFKIALALLVACVIGVLTVDRRGDLVHVLLLVGLGLLLLAFLRARRCHAPRDQ
jgi:hypothetical protein